VTFFGIATADNRVRDPIGFEEGIPIYDFPNNFGFVIVIEGRRGASSGPPGILGTMDFPVQAPTRANVQIQINRNLGDGSAEVCDRGPLPDSPIGGVPGVNPPSFANEEMITNAINDLACRFDVHMTSPTACTFDELGNFAFVNPFTTVQFCTAPAVGSEIAFPSGDTLVTVRLSDGSGGSPIGPERKLIVRVP